jgi:hypothetical protein
LAGNSPTRYFLDSMTHLTPAFPPFPFPRNMQKSLPFPYLSHIQPHTNDLLSTPSSLKLIINKLPHDYSTHSTIYLTAHHDQIHSPHPQAPLSRQRFPLPYRRLVVAHTCHNLHCSWPNRNHHWIQRLLHPRRACPLHSCFFNCGRRYHCR